MTDPTLAECLVASAVTVTAVLALLARRTRRPARLPRNWTAERRARFFGP